MPDPVAPATPAAPVSAAPAVAPAPAPAPSPAAPAQTPAAAPAAASAPAAAASTPAELAKPADAPQRPESLIPDPTAPAEGEAAKPAEVLGAPEKYEFKVPEGVKLNPEALGQFETFAKEKNLSGPLAQDLLDRHIAEIKKQTDGIYNSWYETQKTWQAEITADKVIGGDKLPQSKQAIGRVLNHLGPELGKAFREALDFTGAGNNPAVFRGLVKLAERFSEPGPVNGKPGTTGNKTAASILYPTHQKT